MPFVPGPPPRRAWVSRTLALALLATSVAAAGEDFAATEASYRAYLERPALFYRTRGRQLLAQTNDPRAVPILAQDYAKVEEPKDIVRSLIVTLATRNLYRSVEVLPCYEAWRSANPLPADAWLWYRSLVIDLYHEGAAAVVVAEATARGTWLRSAALRALADRKDPRVLEVALKALPPLGAKTPLPKRPPPPKKGVPLANPALEAVTASLLAEAATHVLYLLSDDKGSEPWRQLAERVILLLEDPGLSVVTRSRIARSLARVFGTDNLGLATGPWMRELAAAGAAGGDENPPRDGTNYFFGLEVVGEHIAFVIDCSDSMLAPLGPKPTKGPTVTPDGGAPGRPRGPDDGLPWERIHNRFDLAREVLKRSLLALRPDQHFTVVLFGTEAELLRDVKGMTPALPASVASAVRALDDIQYDTTRTDAEHPYGWLKGKTNLHGGVRKAFRVRALDEASTSDYVDAVTLEEGCDAIYLLSDGAPSWDDWAATDTRDPDVQAGDSESNVKHENTPNLNHFGPFVNAYGNDFIVDDIQRLNLFRNLPVHCIAIGEADDGIMRRIAQATGGRFERAAARRPSGPGAAQPAK